MGVVPGWAHRGAAASVPACGDANAKAHPVALESDDRNYMLSGLRCELSGRAADQTVTADSLVP